MSIMFTLGKGQDEWYLWRTSAKIAVLHIKDLSRYGIADIGEAMLENWKVDIYIVNDSRTIDSDQ